jgi:hypothetical protein
MDHAFLHAYASLLLIVKSIRQAIVDDERMPTDDAFHAANRRNGQERRANLFRASCTRSGALQDICIWGCHGLFYLKETRHVVCTHVGRVFNFTRW